MKYHDFFVFSLITTAGQWGAESAISALVPFCFGTLQSTPDSMGDISMLRRSSKVFLGSKFAYSSSTFRKTKQLMILAISEKVIQKCQKIVILPKISSRISPRELSSTEVSSGVQDTTMTIITFVTMPKLSYVADGYFC